jgi:hypothetical protein
MATSPSFERINYSIRPAKQVERKMLVEAFRRLEKIGALPAYQYVGFGSPYFPDFVLVHRALNISTMTSMERELDAEERMKFNRPFGCVTLAMGEAGDILPTLSWVQRAIVWLDYDKSLDVQKISDIKTVVSSAPSGSCIVISVNAAPGTQDGRLQRLQSQLEGMFPFDIQDGDLLGGWNTARLFRRVIDDQIRLALDDRNAGLPPAAHLRYRPIFNFHYKDGAHMLTVGGVLYDDGNLSHLDACGFETLPFVRMDIDPYLIEVPNLTLREVRFLDQQLPCSSVDDIVAAFIPADDLKTYYGSYRYFPRFVDVDL